MGRATQATLSTYNLLHNVATIQKKAPGASIIAMVKANAYGHGLRSVAKRLEGHVGSLGVASIDEAFALRAVGITAPITLMEGVFESAELLSAAQQGFHVVFHDHSQLEWLERSSSITPLTAWLKIDSGMGRLGFARDELERVYARISKHSAVIHPVGIMSHFACAEDFGHPLNRVQIERFAALTSTVQGPKSFCNSAAIFHFPDQHYDVIRPGLALYGISPIVGVAAECLNLKPVLTLHSRLIAMRTIHKGESIGYGARFVCQEDIRVGVVAMGYGDGYPRSARDGTPVLIDGARCAVVGRVSMDMMTVDVRSCPNAKVGDQVILWGDGLPLEEVAVWTDNSVYDILTALQSRVRFQWI